MRHRLLVLTACFALGLVAACLMGCQETGPKPTPPKKDASGNLVRPSRLQPKIDNLPSNTSKPAPAAATGAATGTGAAATGTEAPPAATGAAATDTGAAAPATPTDTSGAPAPAAATDAAATDAAAMEAAPAP
jgi:hypothetical protein